MNEQYSGYHVNTPAIDVKGEPPINVPVANPDPVVDKIPVEPDMIGETAMGEATVHESATADAQYLTLRDEAVAEAAPVGEGIVHETIAAVAPYPAAADVVADPAPVSAPMTHQATPEVNAATSAALLTSEVSEHLRQRWNQIQGTFVDEPRTAVQQADALVSEAVEQITQMFASERSTLETQWKQSNDVSTEDLRTALQRYRTFFNRLVI